MSVLTVEQAFKAGTLHPTVHERLIVDLADVCADAQITPDFVLTPLKQNVGTEHEISYIRQFKTQRGKGVSGLAFIGRDPTPSIETRMSAMAGALVRNFVRARVMTVGELIDTVQAEGTPTHTALLVPNFFVEESLGGKQPSWRVSMLLDVLLHRHQLGLQTIIYVSDMATMAKEYGKMFTNHVTAHFLKLDV